MALRPRGSKFSTEVDPTEAALRKAEQMRADADRQILDTPNRLSLSEYRRLLQTDSEFERKFQEAWGRRKERGY